MRILSQNVGVDIAMDHFVVWIEILYDDMSTKKAGQRKFSNTPSGFKEFIKWMKGRLEKGDSLVQVVMEATGCYHEGLAYFLYERHYRVCIVLPNRIKNFGRVLNQFSKTDMLDAHLIAHYGGKFTPPVWQPANKSMRQLRELTRERQDIVQMKTQTGNRLHAQRRSGKPHRPTIGRLEIQIRLFNKQIKAIEREMEQLRAKDEVLAQSVQVLTSIPSIGNITAFSLLAETAAFNLFENRSQLIKYAGLDIVERQSGSSLNGTARVSKRGNSHLRAALFMPAITAARMKGVFQDAYLRQINLGKCKRKAQMAVQRKLLIVAFGLHQSKQFYDKNIHYNRAKIEVGEPKGSPTVAHPSKRTAFLNER